MLFNIIIHLLSLYQETYNPVDETKRIYKPSFSSIKQGQIN